MKKMEEITSTSDQQLLSLYLALVTHTTDVYEKLKCNLLCHHWKSADINKNETIYPNSLKKKKGKIVFYSIN